MESFTTPMMTQYMKIRKQYPDCLLFFRVGDFYELYLDQAEIGAKILNITLTSKSKSKDGKIAMAGVPYHAVDSYLSKLVKAGYKVAICEQVTEPNKYGIVEREVIRIVTPGTLLDEKMLEKKENNFVMSLVISEKFLGVAVADISTGQFFTNQFNIEGTEHLKFDQVLRDELAHLHASECILSEKDYNDPHILRVLKSDKNLNIFTFSEWEHYVTRARKLLKEHFNISSLATFNIDDMPQAIEASGVLLGYLKHTQKDRVLHIKKIDLLSTKDFMLLDRSTMVNLELFSTIRDQDRQGSLVHLLDETITPMGGRMIRNWIQKPLVNKQKIIMRQNCVEFFVKKREKKESVKNILKEVSDIERLSSKLSVGIGNARDLVNLKSSLQAAVTLKKTIENEENALLSEVSKKINKKIETVINMIQKNIVDEPPITTREGRIIREGVNKELDLLRKEVVGCRDWLINFEESERKKTGISSLKVKFNEVFGFFIEVTKTNSDLVPSYYLRKQTMVNGERFITKELKEKEQLILSAEEKINDIEYKIYCDVLEDILSFISEIQSTATAIGILDCILNFAHIAQKYSYIKPQIIDTGEIQIKAGRHAVVETLLENQQFVPNDITLNHHRNQLILITGPNMAGKSVFIRQVALIVLLNQIGSYVPAQKAMLSIVDRIFVRSGASDVITSGLSTFMVEMVETAQILNSCTKDSLIVMDEIGRGTSTYDGISIAWAVAEHLAQEKVGSKTLFATHYHELQTLADSFPNKISNFHMAVEQQDGEPIFLHTLLPGGASHSYGVAVAKLAGIPENVTSKAWEVLGELEKGNHLMKKAPKHEKVVESSGKNEVTSRIKNINLNKTTPLQALNILVELQSKLRSK